MPLLIAPAVLLVCVLGATAATSASSTSEATPSVTQAAAHPRPALLTIDDATTRAVDGGQPVDPAAAAPVGGARRSAWLTVLVLGAFTVGSTLWLDRVIRPPLLTPDEASPGMAPGGTPSATPDQAPPGFPRSQAGTGGEPPAAAARDDTAERRDRGPEPPAHWTR